ncbi:sugar phosphate isomerase/epimerase family protein [Tellurirhabdus bombi]|uniref:sugar phosphate isomerase/epimerase family protein n=1 Tax=Tellurirhabdus bombi TaxID=2907205 RepID=UPI001F490365|nr:sugar phosphate isomerase/epimerase family protein [Tellurirhabdus bombi]
MSEQPNRRQFLKLAALTPFLPAAKPEPVPPRPIHHKLSCNLYSFNRPLTTGQMTLEQVLEFCADLGFDAVDPTAYYIPNYPALPDDTYIYTLKRKAFRLGLDISGTGVRNNFCLPDTASRKKEIDLVKQWTHFAAKFDAPVLRVFSGLEVPKGHTRKEATKWVVDSLRQCADYGAQHGVMIVLQNHADFIETADHILEVLRLVDSDWLALNLDIGSFRVGDPYKEIAKVAQHAATWQIKENLYVNGQEVATDLDKIVRIVRESGYRGYLPIETLGPGDPREKVPLFLEKVRQALANG